MYNKLMGWNMYDTIVIEIEYVINKFLIVEFEYVLVGFDFSQLV